MSKTAAENQAPSPEKIRALLLGALILIGFFTIFNLQRWMDARRPALDPALEDEQLYVNAKWAKTLSMGFSGLVADWYWMRSLQYVGRKIIAAQAQENLSLDDLSPLNLKRLAQYLETTVTLDPQFMAAYEYAAVVLPTVDRRAAIDIVQKGIEANPQEWRLHQHLGYIYWQMKDYDRASDEYATGARLPGAPGWMQLMAARMKTQGGSRDVARNMYKQIYTDTDDPKMKELALSRLAQLQSLDERDLIRQILSGRQNQTGRCPLSWQEIAGLLSRAGFSLDAAGNPLDPSGAPYLLNSANCNVELNPNSAVPKR